ncbi:MAG: sugar phosphate nucleotidyltransferase [Pseudomonadota bacterium]
MPNLDTVIFPVAGLGTRMLPATKVLPKELLPVYDTPLLQFAIDEALAAGARRLIFVSHPEKAAICNYLRPKRSLERTLAVQGKQSALDAVRATVPADDVEIVFTMQDAPLGLGHAVLCAADYALPGPVGVVLPDDLILGTPCLPEMVTAFDPTRMGALVAAQKVPLQQVSSYGIFECDETSASMTIPARSFVEKPEISDTPSTLAAVGRYILTHEVFDALRTTVPGAGGEIQLTDAIAARGGIHAFRFSGVRYDCGDKDGIVDATLAVQHARRSGHLRVAAE